MNRIDHLHTDHPFAGSRMLQGLLVQEGFKVGRKHVRTLMKRMGIEAIYRRPNTSKPAPGHKIYPYLLRNLPITRPNQVWAMDITYIPMTRGFIYLAAVVDWFSRRVLASRVSISLEAEFCVEAVKEALARYGKPEIFNMEHGRAAGLLAVQRRADRANGAGLVHNALIFVCLVPSQPPSKECCDDRLRPPCAPPSTSSRCWPAARSRSAWTAKGPGGTNVFVERLWRTIKYEEVYLRAYAGVPEARASIGHYLAFYNSRRPHSSLDGRTPDQAYFNPPMPEVAAA